MCLFAGLALAGGAAGIGAGATAATTGLLAGSTLGTAIMSDVGLLGAGFSAYQSVQQGKAQSKMFQRQSDALQQQNELAKADRLRKMERLIGAQTAQFGAMNIGLGGGSASDVISRTAYDTQIDIFNDDYNTDVQVGSLEASAKNARAAGKTKAASTLLDFGFKAGSIYA